MKARHSGETTSPSHSDSARLTIGLLTRNLDERNYRVEWLGAADAAREHGVHLICFPGGALHSPEGFEAQANILYDLINIDQLDGLLVLTGNITLFLSPEETVDFHTRYQSVPIVYPFSIGEQILRTARENGREIRHVLTTPFLRGATIRTNIPHIVTHFIKDHGYRRIAFICGPKGYSSGELRYQEYVATLAKYDVPFDPNLVVEPCQEWLDTAEIRRFLDQRNLPEQRDFDAVVGANDERALIMLQELQARGVRVPEDVAVGGIDDRLEARMANPPLTSVRTPFYETGRSYVKRLFMHFRGDSVHTENLPGELVRRRSCGCLPETVALAAKKPIMREHTMRKHADADETTIAAFLTSCRTTIIAEILRIVDASSAEFASGCVEELVDGLVSELAENRDPSVTGTFVVTLERMLRQAAAAGEAVLPWQNAVSVLREYVLLGCPDHAMLLRAEELWGQARACINEITQWSAVTQSHTIEEQAALLHDIGATLISTFDVDELMDVLHRELPRLGIPGCSLFLYDDPGSPTEWSRLMLAYHKNGWVELEPGGRRVPSRHILLGTGLPQERVSSMVVEPLYFRTEQIGVVVFEVGPRDGRVYGILSRQISSALKGAMLVQQAEVAHRASEAANRAKSAFLANMSHELRTPLNAILGYAQLLARSPHTPEEVDYLGIIQRSGEHLLTLINQVLDLSKIEAGRITLNEKIFDLRQLLDDLQHMFFLKARNKGLGLAVECADDVPRYVETDEVKLRQVLINLLNNALKFTEEGRVSLRVYEFNEFNELPTHQLTNSPTHQLCFEVSDTGPGITPEEIDKVFEAFGQTEAGREAQEGTGLGLPISRKFVQLMGGDIHVESEVGKGTVFTFDIQVRVVNESVRTSPIVTRRVVALEPGQPCYRILIVDDHWTNRQLVVKLLSTPGRSDSDSYFELREAANGQEALEIWRTWKPHLIWMDMRMPVMDGYEATRRIRELGFRHSVPGTENEKSMEGTSQNPAPSPQNPVPSTQNPAPSTQYPVPRTQHPVPSTQ